MAHWAKVVDGHVATVQVADAEYWETFVDTSPGQWIQTSYNTRGNRHYDPHTGADDSDINPPLRGNYAGVGYVYDRAHDVFYPPQPYASWTISAATNWLWTAPVAYPADGNRYDWDEASRSWQPRT
jgi:hypothetical protein